MQINNEETRMAWKVLEDPASNSVIRQIAQALLDLQQENLDLRMARTRDYSRALARYRKDEGERYQLVLEEKREEVKQLEIEIAALRPDALAWREREARYQAEKQELEKRMGK